MTARVRRACPPACTALSENAPYASSTGQARDDHAMFAVARSAARYFSRRTTPARAPVQSDTDWPQLETPPPEPQLHGDDAWTEIMDLDLPGWALADVLLIFADDDDFFAQWHTSMADKCAPFLSWFRVLC